MLVASHRTVHVCTRVFQKAATKKTSVTQKPDKCINIDTYISGGIYKTAVHIWPADDTLTELSEYCGNGRSAANTRSPTINSSRQYVPMDMPPCSEAS